ncbi:SPOR domain-containing protein [Halobacillus salinus]|uniref:SPOR domain-containing protein n=1 Tax=Halobacillus salinus TaxID=192814 RepID=A0A4Z0H4H9_9BACI|nr:SPOR domain-containing protein [Halobacillus salinus]TGB04166.1 SPOR domain-containing protein [Halobacillus salinus]
MDSKNKISISFRDKAKNEDPFKRGKEEQAASAEPESENDWDRPKKPKVYTLPIKKKARGRSPIKSIMISSITALLISFGLGFMLLRMFVSLTDETAEGQGQSAVPATEQTQGSEAVTVGTSSLEGYVVQAGVFSTEDKANEWKMKLTASSVSSIIWQRDGQYYLFVGSASTESGAEQIAADLDTRDIETYVKPWTILTEETSLKGAEAEIAGEMGEYIQQHSLDQLSEERKQEYIATLQKEDPESPFLSAFQSWETSDRQSMNWLFTAKAMEETTK